MKMRKELFEMSQSPMRKSYVQPIMTAVELGDDSIICMSTNNAKNEVPDFEEGEELTW